MMLSKWFLCGMERSFKKDKGLAFTFAENAVRKGLPNAELALGYDAEVGMDELKNIEVAKGWYMQVSCPLFYCSPYC